MDIAIEQMRYDRYLASAQDEMPAAKWLRTQASRFDLIVAEGFEERSVGFLENLAALGSGVGEIVVGRYLTNVEANAKYHARFEEAVRRLTHGRWRESPMDVTGHWVDAALKQLSHESVVIDITGLSTRALFGVLDAAVRSPRSVTIAYTEAAEYWPKKSLWRELSRQLDTAPTISDVIDEQPWLFGYEHHVELLDGHEGYDSVGVGRALVGFLPFKSARLAAVLGTEDYKQFIFVAGRPRLLRNRWRLTALKTINRDIVKGWPLVELSTFGYRSALRQLAAILYSNDRLMQRYDVHLALLGSKLQDVACWIASCLIPSITIVTSVPVRYYPDAFSEGIGARWVFPLTPPSG